MNEQQAESWGKKLRAVLSELVDRGIDERRDWHFILQCLLKVGAVSAVEAVWKSLPEKLQGDREFAELRLGAIIRYAKNARLAAVNPDKEELDLAYGAFWDAFQTLQNPNIKTVRMTNRLLVIASSELAGLMARVENDEAFQSFHQILRFVLDKGYGLDIDNIPLSIERRAQERASSPEAEDKYRSLSPAVLNAILDHLAQSNTSPYQLFAVFDVLTSEATAPSVSMRAFEEEEDEEYVPTLSNMTAAEEQSGERRNWLGRRINRASYFERESSQVASPTVLTEQQQHLRPTHRHWPAHQPKRRRPKLPSPSQAPPTGSTAPSMTTSLSPSGPGKSSPTPPSLSPSASLMTSTPCSSSSSPPAGRASGA